MALMLAQQEIEEEEEDKEYKDYDDEESYQKVRRRNIIDRRNLYVQRFGEMKPLNISPIFDFYYRQSKAGLDPFFNEDKNDLIFLFVCGLYSGKFPGRQITYPDTLRFMKTLGLDIRTINIIIDQSVYVNAQIIATEVTKIFKAEKKQIVLIGHSKGSVDVTTAITLYPKINKYIRLFISLMGVFGGSPIASLCSHSSSEKQEAKLVVKKVINHFMKSSTQALVDITMETRHTFLSRHSYPLHAVPAVSVIASRATNRNFLYKYIKKLYHEENDGLITTIDAHIPGSSVIFVPGMDHGGPPTSLRYKHSESFLMGICAASLLATSDRQQSITSSICTGQMISEKKYCCSLPFNHTTIALSHYPPKSKDGPKLSGCMPSNEELASEIASFLTSSWEKRKRNTDV
jgi:hypothetical protein